MVTLSSSLQNSLQALVILRVDRQRDMHVRGAKWTCRLSNGEVNESGLVKSKR